ncbi:hypothetical protein LH496_28265, partial [Klebsiella pneumoniae]|uniref:hypothetical protein n=1 Tax=Klebsiella pneumoniae TaxID=573 RepID=UPI0022651132
VTALITGEVQDLLEIELIEELGGHRPLVPFVEEIVPDVDVEQRTVELTPPPGLLTLNTDHDDETADAAADSADAEPSA